MLLFIPQIDRDDGEISYVRLAQRIRLVEMDFILARYLRGFKTHRPKATLQINWGQDVTESEGGHQILESSTSRERISTVCRQSFDIARKETNANFAHFCFPVAVNNLLRLNAEN